MTEIKGYRELDKHELALIDAVKIEAIHLGEFVTALKDNPKLDQRWVAIATTDLQKGFMALTRAIAQPTTF